MKKLLMSLFALLLLLELSVPALAVQKSEPSVWARDEIQQAVTLGFVPDNLQCDYQSDITRAEFVYLALDFLPLQYNYDSEDDLFSAYSLRNGVGANYKTGVFNDTDDAAIERAYALGIISGRGDGSFDPNGKITRQEAAVVLLNTFKAYAQEAYSKYVSAPAPSGFADAAEIADWASASVDMVSSWRVMNGTGNERFSPLESYTREQAIATFLRLLQNAPVSLKLGNVPPILTYEQEYQRTLDGTGGSDVFTVAYRVETPECTVLYGYHGGHMHGYNSIHVVFRQGGRREVKTDASDFSLSEDETSLRYTASDGKRYSLRLNCADFKVESYPG